VFDVDEPQVGLVDERRRLQRVIVAFVAHVPPRNAAELVLDEHDQLIERSRLAASPSQE
jgi:hypothetical protein